MKHLLNEIGIVTLQPMDFAPKWTEGTYGKVNIGGICPGTAEILDNNEVAASATQLKVAETLVRLSVREIHGALKDLPDCCTPVPIIWELIRSHKPSPDHILNYNGLGTIFFVRSRGEVAVVSVVFFRWNRTWWIDGMILGTEPQDDSWEVGTRVIWPA